MELLKEAKNVVDFATYYPLLNKATADNDSPTPGFLFEEIIKLSHQSSGHRQHLVDFLLARLQISSWPGKQKVVRILHQVCSRGHFGVRIYLRGKDGELRKASSAGGPPDPVLANTPQLFLSSAIQELLTLLFDPKVMREDEMQLAGRTDSVEGSSSGTEQPLIGQGYGSSAPKGKYEGFGNSPINRGDNLVNQVRDMVECIMSPSGDSKRAEVDFLQGEKGDYQPLSLPSLGSSIFGPMQSTLQPHLPILSRSQPNKYKVHKKGRAGGGWDSDENQTEAPSSPVNSEMDLSLGPSDHQSSEVQSVGTSEEEFLASFLCTKSTWPPNHDELIKICQDCTSFNLSLLLEKISLKFTGIAEAQSQNVEQRSKIENKLSGETSALQSSCRKKEILHPPVAAETSRLLSLLLLVEFGLHYDVFAPNLINNALGKTFQNLQGNECLDTSVRIKAKKLLLIINKLT